MARADDLVPLLGGEPSPGVGFRQGVVMSYNQATAENTVLVGGTLMTNLSIFNSSEALLLAPGLVVGILTVGSTWFIMGRITIPGQPDAATALLALRTASATEPSQEGTTTTSYTNLATTGPVVSFALGASGRFLVLTTSMFDYAVNNGQAGGWMSYDVAGPSNLSASDVRSVKSVLLSSSNWIAGGRFTAVTYHSGMTPGNYTVTAKYKSISGVNTVNFADRNITVIAL